MPLSPPTACTGKWYGSTGAMFIMDRRWGVCEHDELWYARTPACGLPLMIGVRMKKGRINATRLGVVIPVASFGSKYEVPFTPSKITYLNAWITWSKVSSLSFSLEQSGLSNYLYTRRQSVLNDHFVFISNSFALSASSTRFWCSSSSTFFVRYPNTL